MPLLLGEHVVAGEIINRRRYSTHGWLALRGDETPIIFQLTGDCAPEIQGKHLRFEIPDDGTAPCNTAPFDARSLARQQIGPTGEITLACEADGRRRLVMEWHSQNGHMRLELLNPEVEWVEADDEERRRAAEAAAGAGESTEDIYAPEASGPGETGGDFSPFEVPPPDVQDDADDPYGLFPEGLDEELADDQAGGEAASLGDGAAARPAKRSWDEVIPGIDEATKRMYEEWDEVTEGTMDVPLTDAFDPPIRICTPDQFDALPAVDAEQLLKQLLARLALLGVAVNVCEHFSIPLAYRMIVEEILPNHGVHPRLPQIGWVQYYDTAEYCRKCEERMEREYRDFERSDSDSPGASADDDPPAGDDAIPF